MRQLHDLDPALQWAVKSGLMTLEQALDCDAFADGVVARVASGEITAEEALRLSGERGAADAAAVLKARERRQA